MSDFINTNVDIELIDIDLAIKTYIENHIATTFTDATKTRVDFKNQERWAKLLKNDEEKDQSGELYILPLILLNRDSLEIEKNRFPHWLPNDLLRYELLKYNTPSFEDNENVQYVLPRLPVKITANYTVDIVSNYVKHNDKNIEQFILNESKYWSIDGYYLRVTYPNITNASSVANMGQERLIRHSFSLNVDGYLLPSDEGQSINIKKLSGVKKVVHTEEEMTYAEFSKKYKNKI